MCHLRQFPEELSLSKVKRGIPDSQPDDGGRRDGGNAPGKYGMLRQSFLMDNHPGTYTSMLLTGRLMPHLTQIDQQAQEQVEQMLAEMMKQEGINETLKEQNQMAWIQAVNRLTMQAEEMVLTEIVYQ